MMHGHGRAQLPACILAVIILCHASQTKSSISIHDKSARTLLNQASQFEESSLACHPDCQKYGGVCNAELGECFCPQFKQGPACAEQLIPSCRTSEKSPPSCGAFMPKSCQCYKQCFALYCRAGGYLFTCQHETMRHLNMGGTCFTRKDTPEEEQWSDVPMDPDTAVWYRAQTQVQPPIGRVVPLRGKLRGRSARGGFHALPLSSCPDSCNHRGACYAGSEQEGPREQMKGSCFCRLGFNGTTCQSEHPEDACWFSPDCNGHGKCDQGLCKCEPGWWGLGCTRNKAFRPLPGTNPMPSRDKLRIYMYELPWQIAFPGQSDDNTLNHDPMYIAFEYFIKYLLNDWEVRTQNPHEANMFFVPALTYFYTGNIGTAVPHLTKVLAYVRGKYPFYNRTAGRDHFIFMTNDRGSCELTRELQDAFIKVVHFGLTKTPGVDLGPVEADVINKEYGCVKPARDVVAPPVPPPTDFTRALKHRQLYENILLNNGSEATPRTRLVFFVGSVTGHLHSQAYSGGVRQALAEYLRQQGPSNPDVLFQEGMVSNYEELFLTTKFCLAPYGNGWGLRLSIAMLHACVPVIIQDSVLQPFEELLPYAEFSVRLGKKDIPRLLEVLRSYSEDDLKRMRTAIARYYLAFIWQRELGGQAYEWTLKALHKRVEAQGARLYHK